MVIPETVLSEAQEYDWAACYNNVERWHTTEPESVHEQGRSLTMTSVMKTYEADTDGVAEKGKSRPVVVYTGSDRTEGAKLWALKGEKDGICMGCGGKRIAPRT